MRGGSIHPDGGDFFLLLTREHLRLKGECLIGAMPGFLILRTVFSVSSIGWGGISPAPQGHCEVNPAPETVSAECHHREERSASPILLQSSDQGLLGDIFPSDGKCQNSTHSQYPQLIPIISHFGLQKGIYHQIHKNRNIPNLSKITEPHKLPLC